MREAGRGVVAALGAVAAMGVVAATGLYLLGAGSLAPLGALTAAALVLATGGALTVSGQAALAPPAGARPGLPGLPGTGQLGRLADLTVEGRLSTVLLGVTLAGLITLAVLFARMSRRSRPPGFAVAEQPGAPAAPAQPDGARWRALLPAVVRAAAAAGTMIGAVAAVSAAALGTVAIGDLAELLPGAGPSGAGLGRVLEEVTAGFRAEPGVAPIVVPAMVAAAGLFAAHRNRPSTRPRALAALREAAAASAGVVLGLVAAVTLLGLVVSAVTLRPVVAGATLLAGPNAVLAALGAGLGVPWASSPAGEPGRTGGPGRVSGAGGPDMMSVPDTWPWPMAAFTVLGAAVLLVAGITAARRMRPAEALGRAGWGAGAMALVWAVLLPLVTVASGGSVTVGVRLLGGAVPLASTGLGGDVLTAVVCGLTAGALAGLLGGLAGRSGPARARPRAG
ncbi:hypothetical protein [Sphaerisporangium sp. TRM90804]|uniref:hypothetical protein n=1 Tax=Sphaerisporangium sp. TRM90804 TaxID=3031113 RepID=UPI00244CD6D0|nr:hypothetical protein [Sphaerisporangium sp. TRM90804]MDH2429519.1 hypothetical protein [Sphaerisporangium sp. TRM90804]